MSVGRPNACHHYRRRPPRPGCKKFKGGGDWPASSEGCHSWGFMSTGVAAAGGRGGFKQECRAGGGFRTKNLRLSPPQLRRGACPRLSKGNKSKCKPYSELRLTRKSTAAAEVLRLEERRANTQIAARIVEVCVVGQVVELGSEV